MYSAFVMICNKLESEDVTCKNISKIFDSVLPSTLCVELQKIDLFYYKSILYCLFLQSEQVWNLFICSECLLAVLQWYIICLFHYFDHFENELP